MVTKTTAQGKTTIPNTPQTAQMFSHFQTLAYLMGAGKLPLMMPAMIARMIPTDRLDMNVPPQIACRECPPSRSRPPSTHASPPACRKSGEDYHQKARLSLRTAASGPRHHRLKPIA